jgi:hypothetical protein
MRRRCPSRWCLIEFICSFCMRDLTALMKNPRIAGMSSVSHPTKSRFSVDLLLFYSVYEINSRLINYDDT